MKRIRCIYPVFASVSGASYACQEILDSMMLDGISVALHCVAADKRMARDFYFLTLPGGAQSVGYRLCSNDFLVRLTEWRYLSSLSGAEVAYIWPGTQLATFQKAKSKGCVVVAENINTHQSTSMNILDREYKRLGLVPTHGISERSGADESAKLDYVDYVFSPSPAVTQSLIDADVGIERIISCSYGLSESDLADPRSVDGPVGSDEFVAIFVGRIGIRKGAHLLLDYWVKSGVRGRLKLVGNIEADARSLVEPYLGRPDIQHIGYCGDLRPIYKAADVFLFPSLEEGSPLVTYLSLGAGLPSVVSPMGAGGVVRDGVDGVVLEPHDEEGWIVALRSMAADAEFRARLGNNARSHAEEYLWDRVGKRRLDALRQRIESTGGELR
jgi:glycosyltransferase involved in cell wall biosynthesis